MPAQDPGVPFLEPLHYKYLVQWLKKIWRIERGETAMPHAGATASDGDLAGRRLLLSLPQAGHQGEVVGQLQQLKRASMPALLTPLAQVCGGTSLPSRPLLSWF